MYVAVNADVDLLHLVQVGIPEEPGEASPDADHRQRSLWVVWWSHRATMGALFYKACALQPYLMTCPATVVVSHA
jgi:hypothetical protein